jgi:macrocin-O-methyltransferase TylF-like protien
MLQCQLNQHSWRTTDPDKRFTEVTQLDRLSAQDLRSPQRMTVCPNERVAYIPLAPDENRLYHGQMRVPWGKDFRMLARSLQRFAMPPLATLYRSRPASAPSWLLRAMGIADAVNRSEFYTLGRIVDSIERFDGSIIECGVYRGSTLLGMAHRLALRGITNVAVFGCDSFEGFPEPTQEDALTGGVFHERARRGVFADTNYEDLAIRVERLGYGRQVRLVRGFFEDTLPQFMESRFSIVHLDCDLYRSYVTCLELLYPRLVPGGYMIFDEYDFSASIYPGAQKAIDEFLAGKPEKIESFPEAKHRRYFIRKV